MPGVNHLGTHGRWAFAEFTEVYQIEADFEAKVEGEFNKMIESVAATDGSVGTITMAKKQPTAKTVEALKHEEAKRKNIPTAEYQSVLRRLSRVLSVWPTSAAIATSTRNWCGEVKMSRTGQIWLSMPLRSISRRRSSPRR